MSIDKFIFILIILITSTGTIVGQRTYEQAMRMGDVAFKNREFGRAIDLYFAAEAFDPSKREVVRIEVAKVFRKIEELKNKEEQAKEKIKAQTEQLKLEKDKALVNSYVLEAFLANQNFDYTTAIDKSLAALAINPDEPRALKELIKAKYANIYRIGYDYYATPTILTNFEKLKHVIFFSDNASYLAVDGSQILRKDISDHKTIFEVNETETIRDIILSPNEKYFAYHIKDKDNMKFKIIDIETQELIFSKDDIEKYLFSPSSEKIAFHQKETEEISTTNIYHIEDNAINIIENPGNQSFIDLSQSVKELQNFTLFNTDETLIIGGTTKQDTFSIATGQSVATISVEEVYDDFIVGTYGTETSELVSNDGQITVSSTKNINSSSAVIRYFTATQSENDEFETLIPNEIFIDGGLGVDISEDSKFIGVTIEGVFSKVYVFNENNIQPLGNMLQGRFVKFIDTKNLFVTETKEGNPILWKYEQNSVKKLSSFTGKYLSCSSDVQYIATTKGIFDLKQCSYTKCYDYIDVSSYASWHFTADGKYLVKTQNNFPLTVKNNITGEELSFEKINELAPALDDKISLLELNDTYSTMSPSKRYTIIYEENRPIEVVDNQNNNILLSIPSRGAGILQLGFTDNEEGVFIGNDNYQGSGQYIDYEFYWLSKDKIIEWIEANR